MFYSSSRDEVLVFIATLIESNDISDLKYWIPICIPVVAASISSISHINESRSHFFGHVFVLPNLFSDDEILERYFNRSAEFCIHSRTYKAIEG